MPTIGATRLQLQRTGILECIEGGCIALDAISGRDWGVGRKCIPLTTTSRAEKRGIYPWPQRKTHGKPTCKGKIK